MAPHSSTLAWKIPWTEEPYRLESMGSLSWTRLSDFTFTFHFHALEKEMATLLCPWDSSCLENPMDRGVWLATVHGSQRVRRNSATNTFTFKHTQSMKTQKSEFSSQLPPAKVSPCQMSNVLVMTAVNFRLLSSSAFNSYRLSFFSFLLGAFMTF